MAAFQFFLGFHLFNQTNNGSVCVCIFILIWAYFESYFKQALMLFFFLRLFKNNCLLFSLNIASLQISVAVLLRQITKSSGLFTLLSLALMMFFVFFVFYVLWVSIWEFLAELPSSSLILYFVVSRLLLKLLLLS